MHFNIYQPIINDRRYVEVNARGWEGVEWGAAYNDLCLLWGSDSASGKVRRGIEHDIYQHSFIVEADDVADTFPITNHMAPGIIWQHTHAKSGSVGDVAIGSDGQAWVCLATGWAELADDVRDQMLKTIDTHMLTKED